MQSIATEINSPLFGFARLDLSYPPQLSAYRARGRMARPFREYVRSLDSFDSPVEAGVFFRPSQRDRGDTTRFSLNDLVFIVSVSKGAKGVESLLWLGGDARIIPASRVATLYHFAAPGDEFFIAQIENVLIFARSAVQVRDTTLAVDRALTATAR